MAAKPRTRRDRIRAQAEDTARRLAPSLRPVLRPESEQMADFQQRTEKGIDGFRDIMDEHGITGLSDYLRAMKRLERKHKKA